ncbi:replication protein C, IncQ-type [uncultured Delftia sp.]|jgi:hypothetical protein|uniref:replication protein C, IncQ-type n=1 Tax=uncultured Delftia sp. TaxID=191464 RepID=UPI00259AA798|nr:replication protein C, IncQ-type [uncultured Delftia sp.]
MMKELTHARMAQPFVHAPLFRSFAKGEQQRLKLDVRYSVKDSCVNFHFWGPEPLGAMDLRVLQGLVAVVTSQRPRDGGVKQLLRDGRAGRARLALKHDALEQRTIAARFRLSALAQTIGYARPSGRMRALLEQSIKRICAITVYATRPGYRAAYHIAGFSQDTETDEFVVSLNPCITAAVLGKNEYLRVDLHEVRRLKSDATHLIHSRLHWINHGSSKLLTVDTLCGYAYGDAHASPGGVRQRRRTVKKSLEELKGIGWGCEETASGSGKYMITRPPAPSKPSKAAS